MPASLAKLVDTCLARRTSPKLFVALYTQWAAGNVAEAEIKESLLAPRPHARHDARVLQLDYVMAYARVSAANTELVFRNLAKLAPLAQRSYVVFLKQRLCRAPGDFDLEPLLRGLAAYTADAVTLPAHDARQVWISVMFLWAALLQKLASLLAAPEFKDSFVALAKALHGCGETALAASFAKKIGVLKAGAQPLETKGLLFKHDDEPAPADSTKALGISLNSRRFESYVAFKKFVWLNNNFAQWLFHDDLVGRFAAYFRISHRDPVALARKATDALVSGTLVAANQNSPHYVAFNWRNFTLARFPIVLRKIAHENRAVAEQIAQAILAATADVARLSLSTASGNFPKEFLQCCVYHGVVTIEQYLANYPGDDTFTPAIAALETSQIHESGSLADDFRMKLESVNTEFTSLEESRLVEYFQGLGTTNFALLAVKQQKLTELLLNLVDRLVRERDNEKLSRIALALLNSLKTTNFIFFNDPKGPWNLLCKLVAYIDDGEFGVDDNDGNFQDVYTNFGLVLSGIVAMAHFFGIDFCHINIERSYTTDYIHRLYYKLFDELSNQDSAVDEDEKTIVANYNNLFTDWANALFNVDEEGLSDDLIKSVNVKQIYKFIFVLFRQAITARIVGALSENSLNNGIDYLSQNFLAPCSLEIIRWVTLKIGQKQAHNELMVQILLRIIEGNFGETPSSSMAEPNFTFRMILNITGPEIISRVKAAKITTESAAKLSAILQREMDPEYCKPRANTEPTDLKNEILQLVRAENNASLEQISDAWLKLSLLWSLLSELQLGAFILEQTEQCLRPHVHADDARVLLDFALLAIISSSRSSEEDVAKYIENLQIPGGTKPSDELTQTKFALLLENHYSLIFNENGDTSNAEVPETTQPKDELMADFEMEDLFNDMPQDIFNDPLPEREPRLGGTDSSPLSAKLSEEMLRLWCMRSPLARVVRYLALVKKKASYFAVAEVARTKMILELRAWQAAREIQI